MPCIRHQLLVLPTKCSIACPGRSICDHADAAQMQLLCNVKSRKGGQCTSQGVPCMHMIQELSARITCACKIVLNKRSHVLGTSANTIIGRSLSSCHETRAPLALTACERCALGKRMISTSLEYSRVATSRTSQYSLSLSTLPTPQCLILFYTQVSHV